MPINRRYALAPALAAAMLLSACGFHMRGTGASASLPFKTVYIQGGDSTLNTDLKRYIASSGTTVTSEPKTAEAVIDILSQVRDKQVLSLNSQGRVREYTLQYRLSFQVKSSANNALLAPTEIAARRILPFNESLVLAKETEETTLYREMQSDLIQQMLRRVAALSPQPGAQPGPQSSPK